MNTWKIVFATLVIFIAGIITGASLVRFAQSRGGRMNSHPKPEIHQPNNPGRPENLNRRNAPELGNQPGQQPGPLNRQFVLGLDRQLKLAPEQRVKIEKLMVQGQERIRQMRSQLEPELRKEMQSINEQIKAILTPEQCEQFDRIMKQRFSHHSDQPERRFREPRSGQGEPREPRGQQPQHPPEEYPPQNQ